MLENFVCDACSGDTGEGFGLFGNQAITRHVDVLTDLIAKWPGLVVFIVPPFLRTKPEWFSAHLPQFIDSLTSKIERVACSSLKLFSQFVVSADMLAADLVHLSPAAGIKLMDFLEREIALLW